MKIRRALTLMVLGSLLAALPIRSMAAPGDKDDSFGTAYTTGVPSTVRHGIGYSYRAASNSALALQNGQIIFALSDWLDGGYPFSMDLVVMRFDADGIPDATFGRDGKVTTNVDRLDLICPKCLVIQPDRKILVAGIASAEEEWEPWRHDDLMPRQYLVTRYNENGDLDPTFGVGGIVRTDPGSVRDHISFSGNVKALTLQPDGKILVVGSRGDAYRHDFVVIRYLPNGSLDTSFDGDGMVFTDLGGDDTVASVAVQRDGKIVVGGTGGPNLNFALVRYNANGS